MLELDRQSYIYTHAGFRTNETCDGHRYVLNMVSPLLRIPRVSSVLPFLLLTHLAQYAALTPDGESLLELKKGLNVTGLQTWSAADSSPCQWEGVHCTSGSLERVESLSLPGLRTAGGAVLSPSVGRLGFLKSLSLPYCGIAGAIPVEIGNLRRLRKLDLSGNQLAGGIPKELGRLGRLTEVRLGGNKLVGEIPAELAACAGLEIIDLNSNGLSGSVPGGLYGNRRIKEVLLQQNNFTGDIGLVMTGLANSPNMSQIDVSHNKFSGTLPPSIEGFAALSTLIIMFNRVTGRIPDWPGLLPELQRLSVQYNELHGTIPRSLGNARNLVFLAFSSNQLTGSIPPELGGLPNLRWLEVSDTGVNGTIPESLGNCSSLEILLARNTSLSGTIPASLGNLKALLFLDLSNNSLEGPIPSTLGACTQLNYLILANNRLSGTVPSQLENCTNLQQLLLQNNQLSGVFDLDFSNFRSLTYLSISNNSLSGNIYKSLLTNPHFIFFEANRNDFVGEFFGDFNASSFLLRVLMLGHNQIQGRVPSWMWTFPVLQILDLSDNHLSGPFRSDFAQLQGFINKNITAKPIETAISTIYNNQDLALLLKGGTQKLSMSSWHFVIALNLAENKFSGSIPGNIGELKNLVYCNLSNNAFTGTIPQGFGTLPLQSLDLSSNFLQGPIPEEFSALTQLSTLRLAYNDLSGAVPSGTQLQGFGEESYLPGNSGLCGRPLWKICNNRSRTAAVGSSTRSIDARLISIPAFVLGTALGFISVGAMYRPCLYRQHPQLRAWRGWKEQQYGLWRRPK